MSTSPAIRRATIADAGILGALNRRLIESEGHRNPMSEAELAERMRGWLAGPYRAWLAEQGSGILGYCLERDDGDCIYIRQLFVRADVRRHGLGRHLIDELARSEWAGRRLRMEVLIGNASAIAFWHSLGFTDYCMTMEREPERPPGPGSPGSPG
jgi:GNAT superfamily N-acetyltransferase